MGGYVDKIQRGQIQETVSMQLALKSGFQSRYPLKKNKHQMAGTDNHPGKTPGTG